MGLYDSITKGLTEAIEYEKGNVSAKTVSYTHLTLPTKA